MSSTPIPDAVQPPAPTRLRPRRPPRPAPTSSGKWKKPWSASGRVLGMMMAALLSSGGHVLLEDFPGLAKTLIANALPRRWG